VMMMMMMMMMVNGVKNNEKTKQNKTKKVFNLEKLRIPS